jgi:histone H3/H4
MTKSISIIPKAPCAKILMNNGAKRVSKEAMYIFGDILEEYADEIAKKTVAIANNSGRKTVQAKDLKLALKLHKSI